MPSSRGAQGRDKVNLGTGKRAERVWMNAGRGLLWFAAAVKFFSHGDRGDLALNREIFIPQ
jgi:hypothetical protein